MTKPPLKTLRSTKNTSNGQNLAADAFTAKINIVFLYVPAYLKSHLRDRPRAAVHEDGQRLRLVAEREVQVVLPVEAGVALVAQRRDELRPRKARRATLLTLCSV